MSSLKFLLAATVSAALASAAVADTAAIPLHNPINGLDVDANSRIQARDALLVINVLLQPRPADMTATAFAESVRPSFYWDTTDDGHVTPRDALLVIHYLTVVPEPATFALAGLGLPLLAAYAWRRRHRRTI